MRRNILLFFSIAVLLFSFTVAANNNIGPYIRCTIDTLPVTDTVNAEEQVFTKVEVEATFPGGVSGWGTFREQNLKADIPIKRKAPPGQYTVIIQFIVDREGKVSNIKALIQIDYGMEQKVMRVLRKSPRWQPALLNGRKVKAYRKQPGTFVVSNE